MIFVISALIGLPSQLSSIANIISQNLCNCSSFLDVALFATSSDISCAATAGAGVATAGAGVATAGFGVATACAGGKSTTTGVDPVILNKFGATGVLAVAGAGAACATGVVAGATGVVAGATFTGGLLSASATFAVAVF
jgi:hypothetical protein